MENATCNNCGVNAALVGTLCPAGPRTAKPIADAVTALLTDLHITRLASWDDLEVPEGGVRVVGGEGAF